MVDWRLIVTASTIIGTQSNQVACQAGSHTEIERHQQARPCAAIGAGTVEQPVQKYYRGCSLQKATGGGTRGNFFDTETGEEYWVSGVKKRGSNTHAAALKKKRVRLKEKGSDS